MQKTMQTYLILRRVHAFIALGLLVLALLAGAVTPVHAQTPAAWDDAMADFYAADAIMIKFRDAAPIRLREGVPAALLRERVGLEPANQPALAESIKRGLLRDDPDRIAPTELGWRFLNDLQALFLPA